MMVTSDVIGAIHEIVMALVFSWVRVWLIGVAGTVEDGRDGVNQNILASVRHNGDANKYTRTKSQPVVHVHCTQIQRRQCHCQQSCSSFHC